MVALFPAAEHQDFWSFDPARDVWTDLSSRVVGAPVDMAPGTLMANAGGHLYVLHAGLRPSVPDAKMWSVDPAAPLWVRKQEVNPKP